MLMYSLVQAKHVCQEITCSQVGTARWTALAGSPHGDVTLHSINCMVAISISFLTSKKSSLALQKWRSKQTTESAYMPALLTRSMHG